MPPRVGLVMLQREGNRPRLAILGKTHRSKWWEVTCFCRRPRKDGSCLWTDGLVASLTPYVRAHAHLNHCEIGIRVRIQPSTEDGGKLAEGKAV